MKPTRVTWLVESMFALDGGAMFGIIPKPLWEKKTAADDKNRISLACRTLLVQYEDGKNVLVDVGMGSKWSARSTASPIKIMRSRPHSRSTVSHHRRSLT